MLHNVYQVSMGMRRNGLESKNRKTFFAIVGRIIMLRDRVDKPIESEGPCHSQSEEKEREKTLDITL